MKLDKKNVEDIIGLTPTQEGVLFHYLYANNPHQYFEQTCLYLTGNFDKDVFCKSWKHVIKNNDTLRASFVWNKIKRPVQVISKSVSFTPIYTDLSSLSPNDQEIEILKIKKYDKEQGFDLQIVPFRLNVVMLGQMETLVIISAHSILYDGWSFNIILKEFFEAYYKYYNNEPVFEQRKAQFKDYIKLHRSLPARDEEQYWSEYLSAFEFKEIPLKQKTTESMEGGLAVEILKIPHPSAITIDLLSKEYNFGVSSFFYAVWGILLQKLCNENDVLFGTTFSGRSVGLKGIENIVGNFLNTLPIRVKAHPDDKIISVVQAISDDILTKQGYDQTSLFKIKEFAHVTKQGDLFDSLIIFENHPVQKIAVAGQSLCVEKYSFEHASNYDLTVFILKSQDTYEVHFAYNTNRLQQRAVRSMSSFFQNLTGQFLQDITVPVKSVSIISPEERNRIINKFNDTVAPYNKETSLKQLLEDKCMEYSQRIAVKCNDQFITYDALNKRCNAIAWSLRNAFGENKICVGLIVDRSIEMVVSVLSVIKAGFTYVPIDPMLPNNRIKKMVDNLSLQCIITTQSFENKIQDLSKEVESVKVLYTLGHRDFCKQKEFAAWSPIENERISNLPSITHSGDIAYVIFTSGSTGTPKGVAVQHRPVINIVEWINNTFSIGENDRVLCAASLGFDLSVYDIFGTLAKGATLCVATFEELAAPDLLMAKIVKERITVWNSAPAVLQNLIQWNEAQRKPFFGADLRLVMLSGDWIGLPLPAKVRRYFRNAQVVSLGGATEAAIWSNYYLIDDVDPSWSSIPYGKPIQNCRYYVLDRNLDPCPIDCIGDLYIGGECLALGYVNDIDLTSKKFINDPFTKKGKMYATGDLARWRDSGNMELIGRKDNQVKIRGYRIELGEIESHLLELPGVDQALAIVDTKDNGEKYICAYYLGEQELDQVEMRKKLASTLPAYMVPLHIIKIEELPVTANGKIDRKQLPKPSREIIGMEILPPENSIQSQIILTWAEILNIPAQQISVYSNFFELGGHSLNVTELTSKLSNRYDIDIQLRDVFASATVEELSRLVAKNLLKSHFRIPLAERKEYYPLTAGQLRMFALHEIDKLGITYNIAGGALINGPLKMHKVEEVFNHLIMTHEIFRTAFQFINGAVVQKSNDVIDFKVEYFEIDRDHLNKEITAFIRPFDLAVAPLLRVCILKYDDLDYCLIIDMHHIIADGYSLKKLIQDFSLLYEDNNTVIQPTLQFKDYTEYINKSIHGELLSSQNQYWKKTFSNGIPRLNLPLDYARPEGLDHSGDKVHFSFKHEQFSNLRTLAAEAQTTLFTVMVSMFNVLLAKACNQTDIIIATPSLGRSHIQLEHTIGMFVNTVVLKNHVADNQTFLSFLKETKEELAEALNNSDVPFEYLARTFDKLHDKNRNPVFDVLFEYDNFHLHNFKLEGMEVNVLTDLVKRAKFDITLEAIEFNNHLECRFEYRTSLFKKETIQWLAERFVYLVSSILAQREIPLGEIDLIAKQYSEAEVIDFNF
jgi:amino acid adenylation domain-containing protein